MSNEYDISRAFKRIENDLIDSMMRNLKRHQVEEAELGIEWEQWQAIQLAELEEYRKNNAKLFRDDFSDIQDKIDDMFWATYNDAQSAEEHRLMDRIKKGDFRPTEDKGAFFRLNEGKLEALLMATKADFTRAEYAMLRRANDQYRQIIFDSMTYANITNDYGKAVDMATKDFLRAGINSVVYKNGARHTVADYAYMALRTGNKRAYLMGEGNAHDRYGLHTVRVNKRTHACPKCVGFLGRLLIDDVYGGGTRAEANAKGIPTLSDAMQAGFLHPNCKDIYSAYIEGVSQPAKPWTQEEIGEIVGEYNQEQEIRHAEDMKDSYDRMAKYSLDPENQARYQARAHDWQARVDELTAEPPIPVEPPVVPEGFTDAEKDALEEYVSGDGMWINQYLRGNGDFGELTEAERQYLDDLTSATSKPLEAHDKLYRSVDASVIFEGLSDEDLEHMTAHLLYGDIAYDNGAYSQGIKRQMETALNNAKGKTLTEKGFMSTTVDKTVAEEFGGFTGAEHPVVIELDTKGKQLKGANLDFLDIEEDPQRERLLARNTRYKINDISVATSEEGWKYIKVDAEFIDQAEDAVEEVIGQVVEQPSTFVPATTIQEAEEYAKRFTDPSRFGAVGVSYEGVSLDVANIINKTIDDLFTEFDVEPFGGIIAPKGNTKLGKLVSGATAGYSPPRHSFILNRKSLKDVPTALKGLREEQRILQDILLNPSRYDLTKMSQRAQDVIASSSLSGRSIVPETIEEVLWHEFGHSLEKKIYKASNYDIIRANMKTYAETISGYATDSMSEYLAESFCSYKKGEGYVDPELIKAFESLRR